MARLIGLMVMVFGIFFTIDHALSLMPQPADATAPGVLSFDEPLGAGEPAYLDYLSESGSVTAPAQSWAAPAMMSPGPYEIADSPDARTSRRDRDYRPRRPLFGVDSDDADDRDADDDDRDDDDDDEDEDEDDAISGLNPVVARFDRSQPVQGEIEPGLYTTEFGVADCHYELWHVKRNRSWALIGEESLPAGRMLVELNEIEPDLFVSSDGCGEWSRWYPLDEPLRVATDGDYWLSDLERGIWTVPAGCHWEKVVGFRGAVLADVTELGIGPVDLEIDAETVGVRLRNCSRPVLLRVLGVPGGTEVLTE